MADPKQCSVEGCLNVAVARGWCGTHYSRWQRKGDPGAAVRSHESRGDECSVHGCHRAVYAKGLCTLHYQRQRSGTDIHAPERVSRDGLCSVIGCEKSLKHGGRGLCQAHYRSMRLYGDTEHVLIPVEGCSVEGCENKHYGRGWCETHLRRWKALGGGDANPAEWVHGNFKGGHLDAEGYRRLSVNGKVVLEHRLVMEQTLGRELYPGENVHHINGKRDDNRPENLELWVTSQPAGQRPQDLLAWAEVIIERYGALVAQEA